MSHPRFFLALIVAWCVALAPQANATVEALVFDSLAKEQTAKLGDSEAQFSFSLTNTSTGPVLINWVRTSCGCTVAELPSTPWRIPPGSNGTFGVTVDLRGKYGVFTKLVTLDTSQGQKILSVKMNLPAMPQGSNGLSGVLDSRTRNMQAALKDRQTVFKNDCARCHATPAADRHGEPLYEAVCAICHDSPHRASMVPDLKALKVTPTSEVWRAMIAHGKVNTLMPGFSKTLGGPLSDQQIESLVQYLTHYYPPRATFGGPTPHHDD